MFNELVFKNDSVFVFMEGIELPHSQILVLEDRTFHHKVVIKLYLNSNRKSIM